MSEVEDFLSQMLPRYIRAVHERCSVSVHGGPARPVFLRATQIYRRENGEWKLVHRHADPPPGGSPATDALKDAIKAGSTTPPQSPP